MIEQAALILAEGDVTKFFENPAVLIGIPLVALGAIGVLLAMAPIGIGQPRQRVEAPAVDVELPPGVEMHATPQQYVTVGIILAVVTLIEVVVYYLDLVQGALVSVLLVLSLLKFLLVVMWFMHLRFDSRLFSTLFTGGLLLAIALFMVVLASLGASLV